MRPLIPGTGCLYEARLRGCRSICSCQRIPGIQKNSPEWNGLKLSFQRKSRFWGRSMSGQTQISDSRFFCRTSHPIKYHEWNTPVKIPAKISNYDVHKIHPKHFWAQKNIICIPLCLSMSIYVPITVSLFPTLKQRETTSSEMPRIRRRSSASAWSSALRHILQHRCRGPGRGTLTRSGSSIWSNGQNTENKCTNNVK